MLRLHLLVHYLVQKSLEPRHWRDIAMLWWQANTSPGGPERAAAEKYGPLGALACYLWRAAAAKPASSARGIIGGGYRACASSEEPRSLSP